MNQVWQKLFLMTLPLAALGSLAPLTSVKAQIVPDNTLGGERSVVNGNLTIRGTPSDQIDGGARRGGNLFHSFQEFNVNAGRGAYFSNPTGVDNILTRVTGGNLSNISGRLGVLGNANLFLINPKGIVFGQNASLDVRGSFFASTASSLIFNNGFEFSAVNPQAPPLLTVNIPIGLRFRDNPGGITVNGIGQNDGLGGASNSFQNPTLAVDAGKTLALVGGNVSLNGGVLQAAGGRVELGGLTAAGTVGINNDNSLSFPDGVARGDVTLTNQAGINVITNALNGGNININARNIGISQQSLLSTGIARDLGEVNYQAGDITLNGTGETRIDQSRIENNVNPGTSANNRNINIVTGSFVLTNRAQLDASNFGFSPERSAGDVNITANGQATINGGASIISDGFFGRVFLTSSNNSVNLSNSSITTTSNNNNTNSTQYSLIQITAPTNSVYIDNSRLNTTNSGTGFAGDININARNLVSITSPNPFGSSSNGRTIQSNGNRGRIFIGSQTSSPKVVQLKGVSLSTTNDLIPSTVTDSINAGDVSIYAQDKIFLDQSFIETLSRRPGNAGNVTLQTNNGDIELAGNAGIFRDKTAGSTIYSNIEPGGRGNTGIIQINTGNLTLKQGSQLQSLVNNGERVDAGSSPGSINIQASGNVLFSGTAEVALSTGELGPFSSGVRSEVRSEFSRNAGNINIQARSIFLTDSAEITSSNNSNGFAGDITLNARDLVSITSPNPFGSSSNGRTIQSNGNRGRIFIGSETSSPKVVELKGVSLSATNDNIPSTVTDSINAGDISIYAQDKIFLDQSFIETLSRRPGNAGNVTLQTNNGDIELAGNAGIFRDKTTGSNIFSSIEQGGNGNAGNINITTGNLTLKQGSQLQSLVRDGQGNAGRINIQASGNVSFSGTAEVALSTGELGPFPSGVRSNVVSELLGNAGDISIQARSIFLTDGAEITNSNNTNGLAGDVILNAFDQVSLNQGTISSEGRFGRIFIGRDNVNVSSALPIPGNILINNSTLRTTNSGTGLAGDILLNARDQVSLNQSTIESNGNRGFIFIGKNDLYRTTSSPKVVSINGSTLSTTNSSIEDNTDTPINAGDVSITASERLSIVNQSIVKTDTNRYGNAGNVTLQVENGDIELAGATGVFSTVQPDARGNGGNINVRARNLSLTGGAELVEQTFGYGDAGKIDVNTTDSIFLSGVAPFPTLENGNPGGFSSGLINTTEEGANGQGGEINVTTSKLQISNGAAFDARSRSGFKGGDITVNANILEVTSGGQILTTSFSTGKAGNITVNVNDRINISGSDPSYRDRFNSVVNAFPQGYNTFPNGEAVARFTIDPVSSESGIFANTTSGSTARGGNLTINTRQLDVRNGGTITVTSPKGQAGNLTITAKTVRLDQGNLTAETAITSPNEQGANINLQGLDLLSLRNGSRISASAFRDANGGNINIDSGFVVAFPGGGSDIIARASGGRGGNIQIKTQGIYGLVPGQSINENGINYIDASSQFGQSGTININTSYLNPNQSLVKLPENVVDSTRQIAQNPCQQGVGSSFAITGRGGIPYNPNQTLASDNVRVGLVTPASSRGIARKNAVIPLNKPTVKKAVPVQGWIFNDKGQVVLTAYDPTLSASQRPWRTPASCAKR